MKPSLISISNDNTVVILSVSIYSMVTVVIELVIWQERGAPYNFNMFIYIYDQYLSVKL